MEEPPLYPVFPQVMYTFPVIFSTYQPTIAAQLQWLPPPCLLCGRDCYYTTEILLWPRVDVAGATTALTAIPQVMYSLTQISFPVYLYFSALPGLGYLRR